MTDYTVADTIYLMFTTRAFATGIPTVLAGTPVISAYENDSATQITAGITLGVSHDSVVGMNLLTIVATGANGYETGKDYNLVITTGTVGGVSVVGEVVGTFSIGRSAASVDLANGTDGLTALKTAIDAIPTTAMRGTDGVDTATMRGTDGVDTATMRGTDGANTVVPPSVAQFEARTIVSASYALEATLGTPIDFGSGTSTLAANLQDLADDGTAVYDRSTDSQQAIRDRGDAAWITGGGGSLTVQDIVDGVWDEPIVGHLTAATTGLSEALGGAAIVDTTLTGTPTTTTFVLAAGSTIDDFYNDQLVYILSGTGAGQVRSILSYEGSTKTVTVDEVWITTSVASDRVAILVSHVHPITQIQAGLATSAAQTTAQEDLDIITGASGVNLLTATQASIDAIEVTTDKFVFTVANQVDSNIQYVNDVVITGTGASGDEWGP